MMDREAKDHKYFPLPFPYFTKQSPESDGNPSLDNLARISLDVFALNVSFSCSTDVRPRRLTSQQVTTAAFLWDLSLPTPGFNHPFLFSSMQVGRYTSAAGGSELLSRYRAEITAMPSHVVTLEYLVLGGFFHHGMEFFNVDPSTTVTGYSSFLVKAQRDLCLGSGTYGNHDERQSSRILFVMARWLHPQKWCTMPVCFVPIHSRKRPFHGQKKNVYRELAY